MLDRVPVPTDNIYKFIALFSLVVLVFSFWQMISVTTASNAIVMKNYPEIEELKSLDVRTRAQEAKLAVLEREKEVVVKDRKLFVNILSGVIAFAFFGIIYGFWVWRREIQPMVDAQNKAQLELLQLQVEKLRLENKKLEDSLRVDEPVQSSVTGGLTELLKVVFSK
ncbi:cell division protein FtsB [Comamonas sp. BIGb0152]|uniref:hypothetical protein n=1 Tax=Comamonas sp. BIGb0152 TaxID=2940601 RepID=UPI0021675C55|nr:hypothetical protein [Comamonas sp. BIGb0152]MCS4291945.1 cell division protein FtsB [Comamonas sp. BIGb0152]